MKLLALVLAAQVSTSSVTDDPVQRCALALRQAVADRDYAQLERDEWRAYAEGLEAVAREPVVEAKIPPWVWIVTGVLVVGAAAGGAAGGAAASR